MTKKKFQKYMPKAGGAAAVALAMTVALSSQANAAEIDDADVQPVGTPPVDANTESNIAVISNEVEPAEANKAIEEKNDQIVDENDKIIDSNEQIEDSNDAAADKNEIDTDGKLPDPELDLPDAPEFSGDGDMSVGDYNDAVDDYNDAVGDYNDAVDEYNKDVDDYNDAADKQDQEAQDQYQKDLEEYNKLKAEYDAKLEQYNKDKADWDEDSAEYQQYLKDLEDYQKLQAEYEDLLDQYENDKDAYDQLVNENEIYDDVTDFNTDVNNKNSEIEDLNAALENDLHAGNVGSIEDVGEINNNVDLGENGDAILDVLNGYGDLVDQQAALQNQADALDNHEGKNAELGSEAYADYLAAVEAYNAAVDDFNDNVTIYNLAVEAYNAAVDAFNETNVPTPGDSNTGDATGTGDANWGEIEIDDHTFGHIDVKYQAAASKDVTVDADGNKTFSDSTTQYTVTGVYANQGDTSYGLSFDNNGPNTSGGTGTQSLSQSGDEFAHNMRPGGGNRPGSSSSSSTSVALNPTTGTVSFYVTLEDSSGDTHGINVSLNANSVYANGSYYTPTDEKEARYLAAYFGENAIMVDIDGDGVAEAYDVSGQSVFVISTMTCDGMGNGGGGGNRPGQNNNSTVNWNPDGLDLVLNLQTMIELHQADNAEKINYLTLELGKTAQVDAPDAPGTEPTPPDAPTAPEFVGEPGDEPVAPTAPTAPDVVEGPGDEPVAPTAPTAPDVVEDPGDEPVKPDDFDQKAPEAPVETEKLEHANKLDELNKKIVVTYNPPAPGGGGGGGGGTIIIPEEPIPLEPAPQPEPQPEPEVEIPDEDVPLANIPKTGDTSALWMALSALSGIGLAGMLFLGRNKKREEI